jgi:hypothetical protein
MYFAPPAAPRIVERGSTGVKQGACQTGVRSKPRESFVTLPTAARDRHENPSAATVCRAGAPTPSADRETGRLPLAQIPLISGTCVRSGRARGGEGFA